ncbi:MAG: glycogen/starch/alpha-glucan phosphorylase, partial [Acutalibacter sp.]
MRDQLEQKVGLRFSKGLMAADNKEIYQALLELTQEKLAAAPRIQGEKKLYYISAEFLVGKLLSNNLINLGIYDEVKEALAEAGKDLSAVEEVENEPSLGNGGLGRLAACYLD